MRLPGFTSVPGIFNRTGNFLYVTTALEFPMNTRIKFLFFSSGFMAGTNIPEPASVWRSAKKSLSCTEEEYGWKAKKEKKPLFILPSGNEAPHWDLPNKFPESF